MMNLEHRVLEGAWTRLEPVGEAHRERLRDALNCDPETWEIMSLNGCGEGFDDWWGELVAQQASGERMAYAVVRRDDGAVVGSTSYLNIRRLHRGLEVGATFLRPEARSTPINPESKRLLLGHAFDAGAIRVEFMIDVRNARSQAAVEKLGAFREGVLRQNRITWTGHVRDTEVFSIIDGDWPAVRQRLDYRLRETWVE
jgi:RimJ/RimL family protein N-acetyltransferase